MDDKVPMGAHSLEETIVDLENKFSLTSKCQSPWVLVRIIPSFQWYCFQQANPSQNPVFDWLESGKNPPFTDALALNPQLEPF